VKLNAKLKVTVTFVLNVMLIVILNLTVVAFSNINFKLNLKLMKFYFALSFLI